MADNEKDLESMSTEELRKLVDHSEQHYEQQAQQQSQEPGFLKSLANAQMNYTKGFLKGGGQKLGDIGASVANWPISGIEHLLGKELPHVPHPNLTNENSNTLAESVGQKVGGELTPFLIPGIAGVKSAQLANRGYQALRAGQELPLVGRLAAAGSGGALEGASSNEGERYEGAKTGALIGAAGQAGNEALQFGRSMRSPNIAENVRHWIDKQRGHYGNEFQNTIYNGEQAGANHFMKPERVNTPVLKRAGEGKNIYALEKYNMSPTVSNAHDAQSDLGKIIRKYANAPSGTLERDAYTIALRTRNRLLQRISHAFESAGVPEEAEKYGNLRSEFSKVVGPYLNSPTIQKFIKQNPTIRPEKFADELIKEETFMTKASKNHPGLLRREGFNKLKQNKLATGAAAGVGAAIGGAALPYAIAKALGIK